MVLCGRAVRHLDAVIWAFRSLSEKAELITDQKNVRIRRVQSRLSEPQLSLISVESIDRLTGGRLTLPDSGERDEWLMLTTGAQMLAAAESVPTDFTLDFISPVRLSERPSNPFSVRQLVTTALRRLSLLSAFFGDKQWQTATNHAGPIAQQAAQVAWHPTGQGMQRREWSHTTWDKGKQVRMHLDGYVGSIRLYSVPLPVRLVLLAGSLMGVGGGVVYGNGAYRIRG